MDTSNKQREFFTLWILSKLYCIVLCCIVFTVLCYIASHCIALYCVCVCVCSRVRACAREYVRVCVCVCVCGSCSPEIPTRKFNKKVSLLLPPPPLPNKKNPRHLKKTQNKQKRSQNTEHSKTKKSRNTHTKKRERIHWCVFFLAVRMKHFYFPQRKHCLA